MGDFIVDLNGSIGDLCGFMDLLASNPQNTPFNDMMALFV